MSDVVKGPGVVSERGVIAHRIAAVAYSLVSAGYACCWIWRHLLSFLVAGDLPVGVMHYSSSDPLGWLIFMFVIAPLVLLAFGGSLTVLLLGTVLRKRISRPVYGSACVWLSCFQGALSLSSLRGCLGFELGPHGSSFVIAWWIAAIATSVALAVFSIFVTAKAGRA